MLRVKCVYSPSGKRFDDPGSYKPEKPEALKEVMEDKLNRRIKNPYILNNQRSSLT